jgi:hypothetical protein
MARGWESKSVAEQIDLSERRSRRSTKRAVAPAAGHDAADSIRKRETLKLSVTRVTQELQTAQNPRYRALLEKSLAGLQIQLANVR